LIAGPIVRAGELLPQFSQPPTLTSEQGGRAIFLIMLGMIKKIAIADFLANNLVDRVFDQPQLYSSLETLAAIYGYALQIYCDFSGYTDIAIGQRCCLVSSCLRISIHHIARSTSETSGGVAHHFVQMAV